MVIEIIEALFVMVIEIIEPLSVMPLLASSLALESAFIFDFPVLLFIP